LAGPVRRRRIRLLNRSIASLIDFATMRCCIFISFVVTVTATIAAICGLIYTSVKYTDQLRVNNKDIDYLLGLFLSALGTAGGLTLILVVYLEFRDARPAMAIAPQPSPERIIAFAEPAQAQAQTIDNPLYIETPLNTGEENKEDAHVVLAIHA
jgi:hypothetical protein